MTFKTQQAADISNVFLNSDEFAETVTYHPDGGANKDILAVVGEPLTDTEETEGGGRTLTRRVEVRISADATAGIDAPTYKDEITIRSLKWSVRGFTDEDGMWMLECVRAEKVEHSSEGHYRPATG